MTQTSFSPYQRILAFDYGLKHIGVAFSDSPIPQPLKTIHRFDQISPLIHQFRPQLLVVGLPQGPLVDSVKLFTRRLRQEFKLPVVLHPEILSTQEAVQRLRQLKASRRKLNQNHMYAAAIILEDYLESLERL